MNRFVKVFPTDSLMQTVLYRKWKLACIWSWIIFLLYFLLLSIQPFAFPECLCNSFIPIEHGSFYSFACVAALSGFSLTTIMLFMRILQARPGNERIPSTIAFHTAMIGLLSTFCFVIFNWNGVCIDALGVATPAMIWGEWFSNGPMLVFLTITLTGKKDLNKLEVAIIISSFLCILFAFLSLIPQPQYLGYLWIALSFFACIPLLSLPLYLSLQEPEPAADIEAGNGDYKTSQATKNQFYWALGLAMFFPLFPINYILAATGIIEPGDSVGVFLLLTLLLNAFFATGLADMHTRIFLDAQRDIEIARQTNVNDMETERYRSANDSLRAFLKYLFHEVRTPLNSLTMGIELLREADKLDQTDRQWLNIMMTAAEFMGETLNNVLSMQKIEEGKMELSFVTFNIASSINKILSALSGPAMTKNLRVEQHVAAEVPDLLFGDLYRVEHVISNLLSNAIKFSPDGSAIQVSVTAAVIPNSSQSMSVLVSVSDEGPGISMENQEKLFDGFFQVRPDLLQQGKGSGLGLALCKQIVNLHGGTIGVESVEGQGSTFHFCIPFTVPSGASNESAVSKQDEGSELLQTNLPIRESGIILQPTVTSESMGAKDLDFPLRVLVVDDVVSNRKMLQALLKKNGVKAVDTAENGLEAVHTALEDPRNYDIIFMDHLMPVMDGVEAVRTLRDGGYANLVVGVTGNILDEDVAQFHSAGADMVMGKPVRLTLLQLLLRHAKQHGTHSRPGMHLSEGEHGDSGSSMLTWQSKF